ncbi:MAG: elongation factor P [Rickettsiales bacterium]|nr:elongation factor P [Rickettsiales bacterium]
MAKISANSIRIGNILEYKEGLYKVLKKSHTQPGKGGAYVQLEMKNITTGIKINERLRSTEDVEKAHLDEVEYQYLFADDNFITVMDNTSYEQKEISKDLLGDAIVYLQDGMDLTVELYDGEVIAVNLPENVELTVEETEAVVKGQTAASSNKPAVLENGVRVMVPPFIDSGDKIVVRTTDSEYVERVKN